MMNIGETNVELRHGRSMPREAFVEPLCAGCRTISGRESGIDLPPTTLRMAGVKAERRNFHDQPW